MLIFFQKVKIRMYKRELKLMMFYSKEMIIDGERGYPGESGVQ